MEATKELARKAVNGDEQAIEALHLTNVANVEYQAIDSLTKGSLERIYTLCAKAAMAGKCLGYDLLKHSALHVMDMTQFLAKENLKCSLKHGVNKDDVFKRMGVVCKERGDWLRSLGEKENESVITNITWLSETIAYACQGDEDSQEILNLTRFPSLKQSPLKSTPGYFSLCADFKRGTEIAAFGRHSTDTSLRIVNSLGMSIEDYMIRKAYPDRNRVVAEIDGQDVSSAVYEELCCVSKWLEKVQSLHSQVESASDEPFGETVQDPTYIPEESDGSETGEEGDEYEKTAPSTSAKQPGKLISINLNFSKKSKKRPKAETAEASDTASSPSKKKKMTPQSVMEPQTVGPPDATSTS